MSTKVYPYPWLDTTAAAEYLGGLKPSTLERWRCCGGGPAFHKFGSRVFYRQEDLDTFIEAARRRTTGDVEA
ncbi:MAG TPA: helix-turn-helix domain-containing protein [Thermoanaerobaculia bacterium]|nr:helix-turn-helix domain-containing protein [Thermoanaerobaculia bacterium]